MLPNVACLCARISARMLHEIVRHLFSLNRPCVFKHRLMHGCFRRRPTVVKLGPTSCTIRAIFWTSTGNINAPDVVERREAMTGSQIKYFSVCRRICTPTTFIVTVNAQTELDDCSDGTLHASCAKPSKPKLGVWPSSSPRPSSSLLLVHRALNPATAGAHPKRSPKE